jgi:hypothetical protein
MDAHVARLPRGRRAVCNNKKESINIINMAIVNIAMQTVNQLIK